MNSMGLVGQVPYSGDGPSPYLTVSGDTYATGQTGGSNQCTCQNMSGFLNSLIGDAGEGSPLGSTFGSAPIDPFGSAPVEPFCSNTIDPAESNSIDSASGEGVTTFQQGTDPTLFTDITSPTPMTVTQPTLFTDITSPTPMTVTQPTLFTDITYPTAMTVTQPTLFESSDLPSMFQSVGSTNTAFNAGYSGSIGTFFS